MSPPTNTSVANPQFDADGPAISVTVESTGEAPSSTMTRQRKNPEMSSGLFRSVFVSWLDPLIKDTRRKWRRGEMLEEEHLWGTNPADTQALIQDEFARALGPSDSPETKQIKKASWHIVWNVFLVSVALQLVSIVAEFLVPLIIQQLLSFISRFAEGDASELEGYMWAVALGAVMLVPAVTRAYGNAVEVRMKIRVKAALQGLVYRKALRARGSVKDSDVMVLVQEHAEFCSLFFVLFNSGWGGIVSLIGYVVILYTLIGNAAFVGTAVIIAAGPLFSVIFVFILPIFKKRVAAMETRIGFVNECVAAIQNVKMSVWEDNFMETIKASRASEVSYTKKFEVSLMGLAGLMLSTPNLAAVSAIMYYSSTVDELSPSLIFASLTVFESLKDVVVMLPQLVGMYGQSQIGFEKITNFLASDEFEDRDAADNDSKMAVEVKNAAFHWTKPSADHKAEQSHLVGVNCQFPKQSLTAVVGAVGSGKSTLLQSILRELHLVQGTIKVRGNIAYVSQTSWLFNGTVRDNIVFGDVYDEKRYMDVIAACELITDFQQFKKGDQTVVGEKGISLSGGQKQRICIARAAYSSCDIVLLDDPLSALDPEVANKVFSRCIEKLMKKRTRILVTNQLQFLPKCHNILTFGTPRVSTVYESSDEVVKDAKSGDAKKKAKSGEVSPAEPNEDGKSVSTCFIEEQGTYSQLIKNGKTFAKLLQSFKAQPRNTAEKSEDRSLARNASVNSSIGDDLDTSHRRSSIRSSFTGRLSELDALNEILDDNDGPDDMMQDEDREQGAVKLADYMSLVRNGGGWLKFCGLMLIFGASQAATYFNRSLLAAWNESNAVGYTEVPLIDELETLFGVDLNETWNMDEETLYLSLYGISGFILSPMQVLPNILTVLMVLAAASTFHDKAIHRTLHAPQWFFDTTPLGRVVSRFSGDMSKLDNGLSQPLVMIFTMLGTIVVAMVSVVIVTPWFAICVVVFTIALAYLVQIYRPANLDIRRLFSMARSPVMAHISETLTGLSIIHAYGKESMFLDLAEQKLDNLNNLNVLDQYTTTWLDIRSGIASSFSVFVAAYLIIYSAIEGTISGSSAGVAISFIVSSVYGVKLLLVVIPAFEASMVSVSRMDHYAYKLPQEKYDGKPAPKNWPSKGAISVDNLSMKYREDTPMVLKGVSFQVKAGERVGIVGRTGSGKSSFMLCMLRLVEPMGEGQAPPITIDGVDITSIPLKELRRNISIVQQHPTMFSGTLRRNLDPFDNFADADLWDALEKCNLKDFVSASSDKLAMEVEDGGSNFSQGQRQLICLCRAVLDKPKILLLDEATSSLDFETDRAIQSTLRSASFQGCTVLTIAHRINTIKDNDKVLVLDAGVVAEYDSPAKLMANPRSAFAQIAAEQKKE